MSLTAAMSVSDSRSIVAYFAGYFFNHRLPCYVRWAKFHTLARHVSEELEDLLLAFLEPALSRVNVAPLPMGAKSNL